MRRYILRQYMHGEQSYDSANVTGTFDFFKEAQAAVTNRICDYNEIVDSTTWEVVWRLNRSSDVRHLRIKKLLQKGPLETSLAYQTARVISDV